MSISPFPRNGSDSLSQQPQQNERSTIAVTVRPVQQQDLASLAEVLANSFHSQEGMLGLFYPLLRMGIYEDLRSRLRGKAQRYACLVAVQVAKPQAQVNQLYQMAVMPGIGNCPIGTVELTVRTSQVWQPQRSSGYLYLSNLAVQTEYRRHGVAQQLLKASEQTARDWGFDNIYLHVLENNHSARRLYRRAGYQLHGVEAGLGTWLMGQPKQLFLRKALVKRQEA
jgi:ribosomal protein S18 acetylase RimI-like enzyme